MALLGRTKTTPIDKAERELSDLVARRELLEQKLASAGTALEAAANERRMTLLDASLDDEAAVHRRDTAVRDARDAVEALSDAVQEIGSKITAATMKLDAARDRAERDATATAVRADADRLHDTALELAAAGAKAIAALDAVVARAPNLLAPDFHPRICSLLREIPIACEQAVAAANGYADQITNGAPIHRAPPAPAPVEPAPLVERERVYCLAPVKWREGSQIICTPRYGFADLPVALLDRAIGANLVDRVNSPRTIKMIEGFGTNNGPGDPSQSIDLDRIDMPAVEEPAEGQPRSVPRFETHVGQPYTAELA